MLRQIVIVGAGRAGASAAAALRDEGFDGVIRLVGDEGSLPYERPPLSKAVLAGSAAAGDELVLPADHYVERGIEILAGGAAREIRRREREVVLADGRVVGYDHLILATGSRARRLQLPAESSKRVLYLRTAADAAALAAGLAQARRVAVIGAGVIGLEVAAAAVAARKAVTVIELGPRVMARVLPAALSERLAARHAEHGVRILTGARTAGVDGDGDRPRAVMLDGAEPIAADLVVAGVGAVPDTALAEAAGLRVDDGIVVDEFGLTSDPAVSAIGDAARFLHPLFGRALRVESWQHAQRHGAAVARNVAQVRAPEPYLDVPWMWSDQLGWELQVAGILDPRAVLVERALPDDAGAMLVALEDGRVRGAAALGPEGSVGRELRLVQMMIAAAASPDPGALADPAVKLKSLLRGTA